MDELTPDWPNEEEEPDEADIRSANRAAWIGAANASSSIQHLLRQAGLTLVGPGPYEALANGESREVVRQK